MDLSLSEDQLSLRAAFAEFFEKEATVERVRAAEPLGFDPELWTKLAATGAVAMGLPEEAGGGASILDLVLVAEQFGRRIAPVPFAESTAAGRLLARADATELVEAVADGSTLATIALAPAVPMADRRRGQQGQRGQLRLVPAGAVAEVVVALDGDELIALRRPPGARPHTEPVPNFGSSPLADWSLDDGERTVLASGPAAAQLYQDGLSDWKLLTAAALGGLRATALEIGVAYVKARKAFGVIIGSFQAVQHRLADLVVAGDGAQLLAYEAAWAQDTGRPDASALASMAFLFGADCAFRTTREAVQFHGGYGVTLEYDIQLYFRRAKAWPLALGDPRHEYRKLADAVYADRPEQEEE